MFKKITKAVIPAAGFGTRMLPASKSVPKEMFPIGDRPAIDYIVKEAVDSGIEDILIITNRGKEIIEDYFDRSPELEVHLEEKKQIENLNMIKKISSMANIFFIRQKETKGLGHAINAAKSFVGHDAFAVMYPDDIIISKDPVCKLLIDAYYEFSLGVIGVQKIPSDEISRYSSTKLKKIRENIFECDDMIEKPKENEIFSNFAIMGRCILVPKIFEILANTKPGAGGEIQITDAMKILAQKEGMIAVNYIGKRFDIGSKFGLLEATNYVLKQNNT